MSVVSHDKCGRREWRRPGIWFFVNGYRTVQESVCVHVSPALSVTVMVIGIWDPDWAPLPINTLKPEATPALSADSPR